MTIITTKFKIGQVIYTTKGPGIVRFIHILFDGKTKQIEYEFEFLKKSSIKYGFVYENEAFKDEQSLQKYLNKIN